MNNPNTGCSMRLDYGELPRTVHASILIERLHPQLDRWVSATPDLDVYEELYLMPDNQDLAGIVFSGPNQG